MKNVLRIRRRVSPVATMLAGAVVVLLASSSAAPTSAGANSQQPTVPRTPWNHPDLQGRWTNATVTPLQRPPELAGKEFFSGNEAAEYQKTAQKRYVELSGFTIAEAEFSGEFAPEWMEDRPLVSTGRTSLIIGPDGQIPPLTPEARKRADARASKGFDAADAPEERPLGERCLLFAHAGPPMLPGMLYNSNYQIVQTPSHVVIFTEMGSSVRIIPLNRRQHLGEALRSWHGDSIGRWEDETLVVDTTNLNEKSEFRGATANLHVVERFTRVRADMILYQFTVEDPATWPKSWTVELPMRPLQEPIFEFACHEGNYGLANILTGARFVEGQPK
jgi:hypothetical protein